MKADIVDYLGKYNNGVIVLLSINHNDIFTEGTLYYSNEILSLTVDDSIESDLGMKIEFWDGYRDFMIKLLKKVVPYNDIIGRLDDIDFSLYFSDKNYESIIGEDINENEINFLNKNKE